MYKIYADDILIYDDTSSDPFFKVVSPKLTMEVNAAGSLTLTIPPGNAGYDTISLMTTDISVEKDGKEIWFGRVLQEEKDFLNNRTLTCEGALAFLNDTTQQQGTYDTAGQTGIIFLLETFLNEHNSHVPDDRKIYFERGLDVVTVSYDGELDCEVNYETTIECINKFILEKTKGYLIVSRKLSQQHGSSLHVDYYDPETMARTNTQTIEFGKNLMDFTKSLDSADFATVIVPLGAKSGEEGQEQYLTVEDVTTRDSSDPCSGRFVGTQTGIDSYGWIERVVHFDDCDNADTLYRLARNYLAETQYNTMEISLSALDLHYLNPEIMAVNLGDKLHVTSPPHGLDGTFTVLKLDIPMDQPQNTAFQLGDTIKVSLTSSTRKVNTELLEQISSVSLDKDEILEAAKANATAIMNQKTNGFITITSEEPYGTNELYVSESVPVFNPNFIDDKPESETNRRYSAKNFWRWNANGLGYTDNYGFDYKATITKDGTIVGERIAAGSIHGSKITAGSLAITTARGTETLSIGLQVRGLAPDALEVGGIGGDGKNVDSDSDARSRYKTYFTKDTTIKVDGYHFEIVRYSDDIDAESGFVRYYGYPGDGVFTVPANGYYRFVIVPDSTPISAQDLTDMANAVKISGESAVITAEDIQIFGMVTFNDLTGESGRTTVINGGLIDTHTINAESIDLYSGFTVYKKINGVPSTRDEDITFSIDSDTGNVYVNGDVSLSSTSQISFGGGVVKTIGDISETADNVTKLANGEYADGTFIKNDFIYGPKIVANELVAQSPLDQEDPTSGYTGSFILRDQGNNDRVKIYYTDRTDTSPQVRFLSDVGEFYFNKHVVMPEGFEDGSSAESSIYGSLIARSGGSFTCGTGGKIILAYGYTWGTSAQREQLTNLSVGQLFFQTD